jgi:tight adherence protein B
VRLLAAAAFALAGVSAPLLVLGVLEQRRLNAFEKQLPQAIDSMAGTLQAGSALPQAMALIAREMPPPISFEFRRVLREMELGLSLTDSLNNLLTRVRSSDLVLLHSAIAIQQRVGGDLAGIFRGISHTIRERLRIRSEINVLTAQGRYSAYVITALPVLLCAFLWFTSRAYISQLFQPGITRVLLVCGIAGMIVGYYAMKKIVTIEV